VPEWNDPKKAIHRSRILGEFQIDAELWPFNEKFSKSRPHPIYLQGSEKLFYGVLKRLFQL
jgi:hypothetical protein